MLVVVVVPVIFSIFLWADFVDCLQFLLDILKLAKGFDAGSAVFTLLVVSLPAPVLDHVDIWDHVQRG